MVKANPHLRISISVISLIILAIFYFVNVRLIGDGVGYGFLGLFALSVLAVEVKNPFLSFYSIKRNLLIVSLFLVYMTVRSGLDSQNFSEIFGFMMGTTSGVFFAFGLGILVSYVFCNIYNTLIAFPGAVKFFKRYALMLILGGAIGNLYDRIFFKAVPDFIDFHIGEFHWFVFNIADIFITVGVIFMIFSELIDNNKNKDYEKN